MAGVRRAILLIAALAACRGSESADAPYAQKVAEAIPRIERLIGVKFKTQPRLEVRTRDEVRQFLEGRFAAELTDVELRGTSRAYKKLGLIPDTLDLKGFMLRLLSEQIVGFYDPSAEVLYIVQGASDELLGVTVTHELVHALQDQYFPLDSIQRIDGDNDRQMAAQAVIEGQATFEQIASMAGGSHRITNLPGGWDRVRALIRESQGSMPVFASAPLLIQETMLFPYLTGAEFIRRYKQGGDSALPFARLPESTEQVMHEDRFFGSVDAPTKVKLPPARGVREPYENNIGEFETRLFLFTHLDDRDAAYRGSAGWDGDRYVSFATTGGDGVAWLSVWDTSVDGAEFFDLLDTAILKRFDTVRPVQATGTRRTYSAGGRTIVVTAREIGGRPIVLYVDVPAGASPDVIDLNKVTLEE